MNYMEIAAEYLMNCCSDENDEACPYYPDKCNSKPVCCAWLRLAEKHRNDVKGGKEHE